METHKLITRGNKYFRNLLLLYVFGVLITSCNSRSESTPVILTGKESEDSVVQSTDSDQTTTELLDSHGESLDPKQLILIEKAESVISDYNTTINEYEKLLDENSKAGNNQIRQLIRDMEHRRDSLEGIVKYLKNSSGNG